jgi:hypothetical protein
MPRVAHGSDVPARPRPWLPANALDASAATPTAGQTNGRTRGQVTVDAEPGTVACPGGFDLEPEPLYEHAHAHSLVTA